LILAGLGLFLLHKIWSGTLHWYLAERFTPLVLLAAVGFLALARSVLPGPSPGSRDLFGMGVGRPFMSRGGHPFRTAASAGKGRGYENSNQVICQSTRAGMGPDQDPREEHAGPEHGPDRGSAAGWGLALLATPLILGLVLPARPLGSGAIADRGINISVPLAAGGAAPVELGLAPADRNVLDWVRAFNHAEDPAVFAGQAADVAGFVYHDPRLAAGQFLVSRFAMSCCSADAMAVGMLVSWPGAEALESDAWVRVRGPVAVGTFAGRPIPVVAAEALEGVEPPAQPYLYP
jgi:uncharacterized repeat protein (TIGR03943 family)